MGITFISPPGLDIEEVNNEIEKNLKSGGIFTTGTSGIVDTGDADNVFTTGLPDGKSIEVRRATLLLADGQPAPADLDLVIATLDGAGSGTEQTAIISGDGTSQAGETGDPLASYANNSGGQQIIMIAIDNGNFGAGSGSKQEYVANIAGGIK